MEEFLFISDKHRNELLVVYNKLNIILTEININYEEFVALETSLEYLRRAIRTKGFYS